MDKKVSVIVPVYRTLQWLARCVQSITGQTYKNLEIILVDDGSPDDCPMLCDDWAKKDARIRVIHKENGGLMAAWMDGVRESTGEYVCFVDSDDWIDACMVEKLLEFSSDCGKEVNCGNYVQEEKNGILWLNPGSCGPRRFHQEITMMMAELTDGKVQVEKINISHEVK